jgi:hypothetical protein
VHRLFYAAPTELKSIMTFSLQTFHPYGIKSKKLFENHQCCDILPFKAPQERHAIRK